MHKKYDVCVIGMGYIGLPTALMIANSGKTVFGLDVSESVVSKLQSGSVHINEPGLGELLRNCISAQTIKFGSTLQKAKTYIICVPTPITVSNTADMSIVFEVVTRLSEVLEAEDLLILESTSPVGTTQQISDTLATLRPDLILSAADDRIPVDPNRKKLLTISIAYCPERVFPGNALNELINNERVVGGLTQSCSIAAQAIYKIFANGDCHLTTCKTAELTKLIENASRDSQIAFANEVYKICKQEQLDVREVINLCNKHPRVNILSPGIGVGGHCIAVDPWFLIEKYPNLTKTMLAARNTNNDQEKWVIEHVKGKLTEFRTQHKKEPVVGILGLSFKPDVNDFRNSPALNIVKKLVYCAGNLLIHEPNTDVLPLPFNDVENVSFQQVFDKSDIVLGLVNNSIFSKKNLKLKLNDREKLIDFCGIENEYY